jgi:hypothetical protein
LPEILRREHLQIMLTDDELKALDDWRFKHRMPSRASAVRELLKRGLTAEGSLTANRKTQSKDFGATKAGPPNRLGKPKARQEKAPPKRGQ